MANTKVTGDVIANGTISTVHLADDAITAAKLDSTATGITFADLTVDTDTLYVDVTNNRVGIGTTLPDEKLDIENGNIRLKSNSDGNTGILKMYDAADTESGQIYPAGGDLKIYSPADILFNQVGNVGINETNPSSSISSNSTVLQISDSNVASLALNQSSVGKYEIAASGLGLDVRRNGTNHLTINSSGNVGIGVTPNSSYSNLQIKTPSSAYGLDLVGRDAGSNSESQITFWNAAQSSVLAAIYNSTSNLYFYTNGDNRMIINSSGNVGIGTTSPDLTGFGYTTLTVVGGTTAGYAGVLELGSPTTNANGQNLGIIAFMDGSTRNAQIDVTRASSTSTSNMHFYTNGGSGIEERMRITSSAEGHVELSGTAPVIKATASNGASGLRINIAGQTSGQLFRVLEDNVTKFQINENGNVGIAETNPNGKLDIKQDMTAGTTAAFTNPHLRLSANNTVDSTGFVGMTFATSTANNYGFSWGALRTTSALGGMHLRYHGSSASGTDIFNIDYVGNVTIASTRFIRSDSSGGYLTIQGGATYPGGRIDMYGGSNGAAGIEFLTGGTTATPTLRFRIDDSGDAYFINGNVGIGQTSPTAVLDIYSPYDVTANPNSTGIKLTRVAGGSQSYLLGMGVSGISNDYFAIRDITNSAYRFVLTDGGNFGIGTTSPQTRLDVDGGVRIKTVEYTWHRSNPITSTNSYRHYKTTLYAGAGNNTMHIMGGFTFKAYSYSSNGYGEGSCMFHNWSGILYSLSVTNRGQWPNFVRSPYISSDGYVVIVCEHNTYSQPVIDFYQFYTPYGWRNVTVSGDTTSNSLTGVY